MAVIEDKLFTLNAILTNIQNGYYKFYSPTRIDSNVLVSIKKIDDMYSLVEDIQNLLNK